MLNPFKKKPRGIPGMKGVSLHKPSGLYRAKIQVKGKAYELGYFKTPEQAHQKYLSAVEWLNQHNGEPFPEEAR